VAVAELHICMNGLPVGVWTTLRTGAPVLRYREEWARAEEGRALSLSLPFTADLEHRGAAVAHYFDNLLPDSNDIRRRLRPRFHARSTEPFDLLTAIGRDCVGAVQLLPPDEDPEGWNRVDAEPLRDQEVDAILAAVTSDAPLGPLDDEDLRISIAGAQEKTALLHMGGKWHRPRGATPTTHILKLPLGLVGNMRADMTDSVQNEWLCSRILRALGFATAPAEIATFGDTTALVVTRFDRRWQGIAPGAEQKARFKPTPGAWIARLPQEDFCQALGVAPDRKHQSDGGPTAADCLQVLGRSERAAEDRAAFALAQLAFWLLAATDGHAKNFSIHHHRGGRFALTPLYDVLSAWPIIGNGPKHVPCQKARLAMAIRGDNNANYALRDIQVRHWQRLAYTTGAGVWERMQAMVAGVDAALGTVQAELPRGFPARTWDRIARGMRAQAQRFGAGAAALAAPAS
jgi:serine/threonine-protein kinase HipA